MLDRRLIGLSQVIIACCLVVIVSFEYVRPYLADIRYQEEFKRLALECDHAMHNEVTIRKSSVKNLLPEAVTISSSIELAVCHQYDKLRKIMLIWGVSEERLALLGLDALEAERIPITRMVEPHRMSRF